MPNILQRHRNKLIAAVVVVLLAVVGGPFVYINFIKEDPPERLTLDDVPASAGDATSTTGDGESLEGIDGTWKIGEDSVAGYRVPETLFGQSTEAVGRTSDVSGTLVIEGTTVTAVDIEVDMTTIESDEDKRDGQFQGRIMDTEQFPTATFTLTQPIVLGAPPDEGVKITASAVGDLTIRGVTKSVTIELTAVRQDGGLAVDGDIELNFDDFEIPDASNQVASVGRTGELELLLVFTR